MGKFGKNLILRLVVAVLSLLFVSLVTFVADEAAPGDRALILAGDKATTEAVARLREELGLNRPWPIRYVEYIGNAAKGDFGNSYYGTQEPISRIIGRSLPMTIMLATSAICLAAVVGIFLGTLASTAQNRWPDRLILALSTLGVTLPSFVIAPIFIFIFAEKMDILPSGWSDQRIASDFVYLILPVVVLSLRPMAQLTRLTRASMLDIAQTEFIKLARAKGVPPFRLIVRHQLRNAILPVVTAIGNNFGILLTGSFIIETAFRLPGIGSIGIDAIRKQDSPVIQATVLVGGALFVFINLVIDLIMPILDPRIREAQV